MIESCPAERPRLGLLNLMAASVLPKTEHQWRDGFAGLAEIIPVRFDDDPRWHHNSSVFLDEHVPLGYVADELDGLIVTGANLERQVDGSPLDFDDIRYIDQLRNTIDWAESDLRLTVYSCLASHIALEHLFDIQREILPQKVFGVYCHDITDSPLTAGLTSPMQTPHSRWGNVSTTLLEDTGIDILAEGYESGWLLAQHQRRNGTTVFLQGHPEYERDDLAVEYRRDQSSGQEKPYRYFLADDPSRVPNYTWHHSARILFRNIAAAAIGSQARSHVVTAGAR